MKFIFLLVFALLFSSLFAHDPLNWHYISPPIYSRYLNAVQVVDINTIVIAGGNETNDAIRTILRSDDGGQSFDLLYDRLDSSWLKSVYFINDFTGFAVGYDGAILKTTDAGQTWASVSAPANVATRNFNSIFFVNPQIGFIAGGNRTNDSIQTILKTTDGGDSWTVLRDAFGYWLNAVYFSDANNGFVVGDNGVALKTTDGGNNWNQMTLPGNVSTRDFNTVFFLDANTGLIGGGNKTNDSIQTILKTTDGGSSWNIIQDNLSPWITAIHFPIQFPALTTGFAVGDKGTVLITEDAGDTWNQVAIPDTTNDTLGLRSVYFLNLDFGIATGIYGKILVYKSTNTTIPIVQTDYATNIGSDKATLNGTVNANGSASYVMFEYGTTLSLGGTLAVDTFLSNSPIQISADISGLNTNTIYFFRIKAINSSGISNGEIKQFYVGENPIPNWDFEWWDSITAFVPKDWVTLGVFSDTAQSISLITSYDGSFAVAMEPAAVLFGLPPFNNSMSNGGVPFAARPDSLIGYFNYNINVNDTVRIFLYFKKNGVFNSQQIFYVTGSSSGSFQRLSFPITYTDNNIPDSIIIAILSTDLAKIDFNSYLAVDNISFSGTSLNIPNHNFEDWDSIIIEKLNSWFISEDPFIGIRVTASKTTDSQHGNFAIKLQNRIEGTKKIARATTYNIDEQSSYAPSFAVHARHATFNCYLKYFPENSDSIEIVAKMYRNGLEVGDAGLYTDTIISDYTPFVIPITYSDPNVIPDSATIFITVATGATPHGNSTLYIDNLSFDGFYVSSEDAIATSRDRLSWKIYPNPTQNNITIGGISDKAKSVIFSVVDITGKVVLKNNADLPAGKFELALNLEKVQSGCYIIILQQNGAFEFRKLIIGK